MKGIVLSSDSDNNKTVVLTDEGIVKTINGTFEIGKKVNIRPKSKKRHVLKNISIVLGTCAVLMVFTLGSLYAIGRLSDSDDNSAVSSSQDNSGEGGSTILNDDTSSTAAENNLNESSESEEIADDNSGSEDSSSDSDNISTDDSNTAAEGTSNIPDASPSANDGTTPPEIPEGGQDQGPQGGQAPSGQAPDGQQPGTMGEAPATN
ncbi:hypothetical protein SAMN04487884_10849 [Butyrivibrio fibrisolvens]|uniref:RsgI N-terminal anti-sigma domain-containing protein n=1 Tax=Butyrivibrio fibrisolvens TaxID=831 RepID=A0A1H9QLI3_BUTFI|nr:hypothetical protein [Butyrivibrio fibrisolvens]SER61376.1 hypothetical protein SAMN04487884_10849 [Butyrivibrio fibrisolvens]